MTPDPQDVRLPSRLEASSAPLSRFDRVFLGLAYGAVVPVVGFLAGWWLSVPVVPERWVFAVGVAGLVLGLAIDVPLHRWWVRRGYGLDGLALVALCGFYTVLALGFFMGVPVPILAVGVAVGVFAARGGADVRSAARVTAAWMALACVASASFALASPSTPDDLEGMLALPFTVTVPMIVALICVGGVALVAAQYWLTTATARWWTRLDSAAPRTVHLTG
ncbi:hypothetical protein [Cellulomonas sp. KRMCY2]|uniref:hypothetical protein n=1 Tax=Cellulomonas sp. KRMCY2 TaxID=1304865 RepID=UPI00045EB4D8|nr:hypothetical protein [Cellulomonas sp. KRMCY2]